jgi:RNA polymerase-binding protein DksA
MDKKILEELEKKLKTEGAATEEQLKKFATKDDKMKGDWDTKFPKMDKNDSSSSGNLESAADEVEEYSELLPVEHSLELRLQKINKALEKIKGGTYGKCEKCNKEIPLDRLMVSPESALCLNCNN